MPLSCSARVKAEALGAFHAQRPCYTALLRHPWTPILAMHESTICQEAFKQLVLTAARTDSLLTDPRHARIH